MKSSNPSILFGLILNIFYLVWLYASFFALNGSLDLTGNTSFFSSSSALYLCLSLAFIQLLSVFCHALLPRFSFYLGVIAAIPLLPISIIFIYGLYTNTNNLHFFVFEKYTGTLKKNALSFPYFGTIYFFIVGCLCLALAIGFGYDSFYPGGLIFILASSILFLSVRLLYGNRNKLSDSYTNLSILLCLASALACFYYFNHFFTLKLFFAFGLTAFSMQLLYSAKSMAKHHYIYIQKEQLVLFPSPTQAPIVLPFQQITSYNITANKVILAMRIAERIHKAEIDLLKVVPVRRTELALRIQNTLEKHKN